MTKTMNHDKTQPLPRNWRQAYESTASIQVHAVMVMPRCTDVVASKAVTVPMAVIR